MFRVNEFRLPYMKYMLERARVLFHSRYVGFINSDILISDRIFLVMDLIDAMAQRGTVKPIVGKRERSASGREDSLGSFGTFPRPIC